MQPRKTEAPSVNSSNANPQQPTRIRSVTQVGERWRVVVVYGERNRRTLWFSTEAAKSEAVDALKASGVVCIEGTRGFGKMDPERHRAIASAGGKAVHACGRAHEWTPQAARAAGQKGGAAILERYGAEHFAKLGRKGARASELQREQACAKKS